MPPNVSRPSVSVKDDKVSVVATRKGSASASYTSLMGAESRSKGVTMEPEA